MNPKKGLKIRPTTLELPSSPLADSSKSTPAGQQNSSSVSSPAKRANTEKNGRLGEGKRKSKRRSNGRSPKENGNHLGSGSNVETKISAGEQDSLMGQTQRFVTFSQQQEQTEKFKGNAVKTAKYSALTWAPKSLLWQFKRAANIYFLIISILTAMPFSPKQPASMIGTFAAVLIFTMLKEAYEDYFRHVQDRKVNRSATLRLDSSGHWEEIMWKDVQVGDMLKILEGEQFPADLVFVKCSASNGCGFVDTMNLDGETNLKERLAYQICWDLDDGALFRSKVTLACDQPHMSLIKWNCNISVNGSAWEPIGMNQLLLRGCVLKNTDYVYGVVVYTGHESKVMLNSKEAPSKTSNVLRRMNKMLYTVFAFQALVCLTFAAGSVSWQSQNSDDHSYLEIDDVAGHTYIIQTLTFYVAYSHLIPISLYVALEVVKLILAYLIGQDLEMYYAEDDRPTSCRTSDLVEELGQVEFIFSDKTGTLTWNIMEFKKCSINGVVYGVGDRPKNRPNYYGVADDTRPYEILMKNDAKDPQKIAIEKFFTCMSVCHTVFPSENPDKKAKTPKYQAASPDELALVEGSVNMGYIFTGKLNNVLSTKFMNEETLEWPILCEIPFNSTRKRMSLLVREPETNKILMFTKGADTVMMPMLTLSNNLVQQHLDEFAIEGLRTLVLCQRYIEQKEYDKWIEVWNKIQLSNADDKDDKLDAHAELIEHTFDLIGASAIEDKLQKGVPETIDLMMRANIRVWVLTGDKQETAIEIGKSWNLLKTEMALIDLSSDSHDQFAQKLEDALKKYKISDAEFADLDRVKFNLKQKVGIVINGQTLTWALDYEDQFRQTFFKLGYISDSCICCRVSPAQKAQVVALCKENGPWVTLSIGDGANDVSMIQEAHIGVGIAGKEGTQAMRASDYAFGQFRYLAKLLLVHGRWGYRRVSWFICYYFYKNIAVVFTEIWFALFNGFSGQIYFLDWLPMLYNAFWTSWPCMFTYIFEQDLNPENSIEYPVAYGAGQRGIYFTFQNFWTWVGMAFWHGLVCYYVPMMGFQGMVDDSGQDNGLWWISTISFTLIIHVITIKLFIESNFWNKINVIWGLFSIFFYYCTVLVLNTETMAKTFQPELNHLFNKILGTGKVWIVLFFAPLIATAPDYFIKMYRSCFHPNPVDKLMKLQKSKENGSVDLNISEINETGLLPFDNKQRTLEQEKILNSRGIGIWNQMGCLKSKPKLKLGLDGVGPATPRTRPESTAREDRIATDQSAFQLPVIPDEIQNSNLAENMQSVNEEICEQSNDDKLSIQEDYAKGSNVSFSLSESINSHSRAANFVHSTNSVFSNLEHSSLRSPPQLPWAHNESILTLKSNMSFKDNSYTAGIASRLNLIK